MLSFDKVTKKDVLLAHVYPDDKSRKPLRELWFTPKFKGEFKVHRQHLPPTPVRRWLGFARFGAIDGRAFVRDSANTLFLFVGALRQD